MRITSPVIGPVLTIELRVLIAGLVLLLYVWMFKKSIELKAYWKEYLIVGALNAAIPFTLIAAATLHLPASVAAILTPPLRCLPRLFRDGFFTSRFMQKNGSASASELSVCLR